MSELLLTRGLPASGKSTWARGWASVDPERRARVCRDDVRRLLFDRAKLPYELEQTVTRVEQAMVRTLLGDGKDVVVDATNLRAKYARQWADLAVECGAGFRTVDGTFLAVSVEECKRRDSLRTVGQVGPEVIDSMARFLPGLGPVVPSQPKVPAVAPALYVPDVSLPPAWLFDVDGTLALPGERGPFEESKVSGDLPNPAVVRMLRALRVRNTIIVMSARTEGCRADTQAWLDLHVGRHPSSATLLMRKVGDQRNDAVVKAELFDAHVRGRWNVRGVVDDRDRVVRMWRQMGLTCFQVAEGNF